MPFGINLATGIPPVSDRFISLNVGGTLILKACGFIEDHQARILDVTENSLRLKVGWAWYKRLLFQTNGRKPIEIQLTILPADSEEEQRLSGRRYPQTSYCSLKVSILAAGFSWSQEEFQFESKRLLWALRSHFMAC